MKNYLIFDPKEGTYKEVKGENISEIVKEYNLATRENDHLRVTEILICKECKGKIYPYRTDIIETYLDLEFCKSICEANYKSTKPKTLKYNEKPKAKYELKGDIFMRMYSSVFNCWIYNIKGIGWVKEKNIEIYE